MLIIDDITGWEHNTVKTAFCILLKDNGLIENYE